ncbi:hypothetical protein PR002_g6532 [Phytophthora rubi]|uniref:Secreted protein n=1 Tax=Phytophthora rubi TaxID=129364 RepID=A0A6A3N904_9STRA|nr:hypothetical protein PR002_g6532 [Phytophthora rubi]
MCCSSVLLLRLLAGAASSWLAARRSHCGSCCSYRWVGARCCWRDGGMGRLSLGLRRCGRLHSSARAGTHVRRNTRF